MKLIPPQPEIPPTFLEQYWPWLLVFGIPALFLTGAVILILRMRARSRSGFVEPAAEQARRELSSLVKPQVTPEVVARVTRILRRYLTCSFELPAEEMTTRELNSRIQSNQRIGPEIAPQLIGFFENCDQLKFAPGAPLDSDVPRRGLELLEICERRRTLLAQACTTKPPVCS